MGDIIPNFTVEYQFDVYLFVHLLLGLLIMFEKFGTLSYNNRIYFNLEDKMASIMHYLDKLTNWWLYIKKALGFKKQRGSIDVHKPEKPRDLVSVIILTHSRLDLLRQSIRYLFKTKKNKSFDYEIIVVDNASVPKAQNEIREMLKGHPEVKIIRNEENLSYSYANDGGAKAARGNYYCFSNDDIMAKRRNWLIEMMSCMKRHEKAGVVGAKLLYPNRTIQHAGVSFHKDGEPFHIYNAELSGFKEANIEKKYQAVTFACVLVKRETYVALNGMEKLGKKFEYYVEDFDFCLRAGELGWETWYCPKAELIHYSGSTSSSKLTEEATNKFMARFISKWKDKVITEL